MNKKKMLSNLYLGVILLFIYLPIISLIVFSFNDAKSLVVFKGFSFRWYKELFTNDEVIQAIITTVIVAVVSTVISTIIGTFASLALTKQRAKYRKLFLNLNNIPIVSPEIITGIALLIFFGSFAITRGYLTMILAHIAFSTPYVVVAVYPKAKSLDGDILDAAYDLGATPTKALTKIIFPQLKPAIIAGVAIAFAMSFDDFIITLFATAGSPVTNISKYLYTLKRGMEPTANALSTIIILVITAKIIYDYFKLRKNEVKE